MEWGTVSLFSMAGMLFSLVVSVGLPLVLAIFIHKRTNARLISLLVGATVFIAFALILEQILHVVVFSSAGDVLASNLLLYALYGAMAAALFEETGRYIGMRFFMKDTLDSGNALMYGVGHGGVESIMLLGMTSFNNLVTSVMINNGGIAQSIAQMDAAEAQATYEQFRVLWESPSYLFFLSGMERIAAILLQISLSIFMYRAVKNRSRSCLLLAYGIHFSIDFSTVLASGFLPAAAVELTLFALTAVAVWYAIRLLANES